jgi:hypothetical protein
VNVILYSGLGGGGGGGILVVLCRREVVGRKTFRGAIRATRERRVSTLMAQNMVLGGMIGSFGVRIYYFVCYSNDMRIGAVYGKWQNHAANLHF